jgi:ribonuclease HII
VAAAVLLDPDRPIDALTDSKMLSPGKREALAQLIQQHAVDWGIGWASESEVDELNVLRASHVAMQRAVAQLSTAPEMVWVDGNKTPTLPMPSVAIVKGDKLVPQISAASILAKVTRDRYMVELDGTCPGYGFAQHKGYPTKMHLAALAKLGASPHHRVSFAPVQKALA